MTKPIVSIGIPAFNEGANIRNLLLNLLAQTGEFEIAEIVVINDASTDNTLEQITSIGNDKIEAISNSSRLGKAESANIIASKFKGDFLVVLDADVLPANDRLIANLIQPFQSNEKVGIVSGKINPVPASNFFERTVRSSVAFKIDLARHLAPKSNIYLCHGMVRAFSRKFLDDFKWRPTVGEDAFSYLACVNKGLEFVSNDEAEIFFRVPANYRDYSKQSRRFVLSKHLMKKYFDPDFVKEQYQLPLSTVVKETLMHFISNPVLFTSYVGFYLIARVQSLFAPDVSHIWDPSSSTKELNII